MPSIINATTTNGVAISPDNSGSLQLATNNGTTAVTIDTSQNVGIGTTSANKLGITKAVTTNSSSGYAGYELSVGNVLTADFITNSSNAFVSTRTAIPLAFQTNDTERMRITSGGDAVVGGTVACNSSSGRGNITINGTSNSILNFTNNNNSSEGGYLYFNGTDMVFSSSRASSKISVVSQTNGVVLNNGATSWSSLSDERVKDIIEPITDGLNKVASIRPVIGKYKTDEEGTRRSFLIAQDVQAVLPEAVVAQNDEIGTLTLSYTDTIPLLVKAIQELKAELDSVKAELNTLKNHPVEGTE